MILFNVWLEDLIWWVFYESDDSELEKLKSSEEEFSEDESSEKSIWTDLSGMSDV